MNELKIKLPSFCFLCTVVLFSLPGLTYAEVKSLRCTYLLEEWKISNLKNDRNCPSGKEGLGKPWRWDTYTFDLSPDTKTTPVEKTIVICTGVDETKAGELTVTPSFLLFKFPNDPHLVELFGPYEKESIDREMLETNNGAQCEIIKVNTSKNRI